MNRFTQTLRQLASRLSVFGGSRPRRRTARLGQTIAVPVETCEPRQVLSFQGLGAGGLVENAGFPPKDIVVGDVNRDGAADIVSFDRGNSAQLRKKLKRMRKDEKNKDHLKTFDFVVANPPFSFKSWSSGVNVANAFSDFV